MSLRISTASKPSMIILCGLGIGAYWAWNFVFIDTATNSLMWMVNVFAHLATLALSIPLEKRLASLLKRPWFIVSITTLVVVGTVAYQAGQYSSNVPQIAAWISAVVVGASSAGLFLLWSASYIRFTIVREQEAASYCGIVLGFLINVLVMLLPGTLRTAVITMLPIISAVSSGAVNRAKATDIKSVRARTTFPAFKTMLPLRLVLCTLVCGIPMGYFKASFEGSWSSINTLALVCIVVAIVFEVVYTSKNHQSFLPKVIIMLIAGGMIILPVFSEFQLASGVLISVGSFIFRAYLYQICGMITTHVKGASISLLAFATCLLDTGWIAGICLHVALKGYSPTFGVAVALVIAYVVFAVGLFILPRRFDYFSYDDSDTGESESTELLSQEVKTTESIERLAVKYSLTRREKEVASCLVQGMGVIEISEVLVVSKNTAKTHVNHIYQKCNVHSKEEFAQLVSEIE